MLQGYYEVNDVIEKKDAKKVDKSVAQMICSLLLQEASGQSAAYVNQNLSPSSQEQKQVEYLRLLCRVVINLSDFDKPTVELLRVGIVDKYVKVLQSVQEHLNRSTSTVEDQQDSDWTRAMKSCLLALTSLTISEQGKKIVGEKFMQKYLSILLDTEHYHYHIRRQAAEGINMLLKGSAVNKKLLKNGANVTENLHRLIKLLKISGDYALQANITEIIFRLKFAQRQVSSMFNEIDEHSTLFPKFKDLGKKDTDFIQGVRAFVNSLNEAQGDERRVFTLETDNMYTGIYAFNPSFIDFGTDSLTFYAACPSDDCEGQEDEMDKELQEINYRDIRTMRLSFSTGELLLQLSEKLEFFDMVYNHENDQHFIGINFPKGTLKLIKERVASMIVKCRAKYAPPRKDSTLTSGPLTVHYPAQETTPENDSMESTMQPNEIAEKISTSILCIKSPQKTDPPQEPSVARNQDKDMSPPSSPPTKALTPKKTGSTDISPQKHFSPRITHKPQPERKLNDNTRQPESGAVPAGHTQSPDQVKKSALAASLLDSIENEPIGAETTSHKEPHDIDAPKKPKGRTRKTQPRPRRVTRRSIRNAVSIDEEEEGQKETVPPVSVESKKRKTPSPGKPKKSPKKRKTAEEAPTAEVPKTPERPNLPMSNDLADSQLPTVFSSKHRSYSPIMSDSSKPQGYSPIMSDTHVPRIGNEAAGGFASWNEISRLASSPPSLDTGLKSSPIHVDLEDMSDSSSSSISAESEGANEKQRIPRKMFQESTVDTSFGRLDESALAAPQTQAKHVRGKKLSSKRKTKPASSVRKVLFPEFMSSDESQDSDTENMRNALLSSFNTLFKMQEMKKEKKLKRLKGSAERRIETIITESQQKRMNGAENATAWYTQRIEDIKNNIAATSKKMKSSYDRFHREMNEFVKLHTTQCTELSELENQLADKMHLMQTGDRVRVNDVRQECEKVIDKFHREARALKSSKQGEMTNLLQNLLNQSLTAGETDTSEDEIGNLRAMVPAFVSESSDESSD